MILDEPTGIRVITAETELPGRQIVSVKLFGFSGLLYFRLSDKSGQDVLACFEVEHGQYECSCMIGLQSEDVVGAIHALGFIDDERFKELR